MKGNSVFASISILSQIVYTVYKWLVAVKKKYGSRGPDFKGFFCLFRTVCQWASPGVALIKRSRGKMSDLRAVALASLVSSSLRLRGMLRFWPG